MFGYKFGYIVELMITNPFKGTDIDGAIEKLNTTGRTLWCMCKLEDHHPAGNKK